MQQTNTSKKSDVYQAHLHDQNKTLSLILYQEYFPDKL